MRHTTAMYKLDEYPSILFMHAFYNLSPAFHLLLVVKTSRSHKTAAPKTPSSGLAKYEPRRSPLLIVLLHKWSGDAEVRVAAFAGESGHDDSIWNSQVAQLECGGPVYVCVHRGFIKS